MHNKKIPGRTIEEYKHYYKQYNQTNQHYKDYEKEYQKACNKPQNHEYDQKEYREKKKQEHALINNNISYDATRQIVQYYNFIITIFNYVFTHSFKILCDSLYNSLSS
jgi:hypothetical protein